MSTFHSVSLDDSIPLVHYLRHPHFGEFWLSSFSYIAAPVVAGILAAVGIVSSVKAPQAASE
jgi:hypothetical protein